MHFRIICVYCDLAKRLDRDEFVEIDWTNVRDGMNHNFMKLNSREWLNISIPYDTGSVLHYSGYAFAKDKSKPTMVHKGWGEPKRDLKVRLTAVQFEVWFILRARFIGSEPKTNPENQVHSERLDRFRRHIQFRLQEKSFPNYSNRSR